MKTTDVIEKECVLVRIVGDHANKMEPNFYCYVSRLSKRDEDEMNKSDDNLHVKWLTQSRLKT